MIKHLLLAPHNDDEGLFCSYIIQKFKPLVLIVTDAYKHEAKYGKEGGILVRRKESEEAMKILGVDVDFLGIPDNALYLDNLIINLEDYKVKGKVFAPALQEGHADHDIVSLAAKEVWGDKVVYYSTYTKDSLEPKGDMPIIPTEEEKKKKTAVLACYKSQLKVNKHHFDAVINKPEYYII